MKSDAFSARLMKEWNILCLKGETAIQKEFSSIVQMEEPKK